VPIQVLTCSALKNEGITDVWQMIKEFLDLAKKNKSFEKNRIKQNQNWFIETVNNNLYQGFYANKSVQAEMKKLILAIKENKISPFFAAKKLLAIQKP